MAACASDHDAQRLWRQIAVVFEQLADLPAREGFWVDARAAKVRLKALYLNNEFIGSALRGARQHRH
jgi:hypothetical protein